jgi:protein tyrosine phosphatase (PTP) superfamily phosphohydrolase (DUF442 family)
VVCGDDKQRKPATRRVLGASMVVLAAVAIAAGASYAHWVVVRHRLTVITDGVVYESAEMPPQKLLETVGELGIRTVIDLRRNGPLVAAEREALALVGVGHFHLPTGQVPSPETIDAFLATMDDPANRPVLIHCKDGSGRSVLFSALYRIEYEGWSNDRARHATRMLSWRGSFAPEQRKGVFLLSYVPRRAAASAASAGKEVYTATGPRSDP